MIWERSRDGGPWEPGASGRGDDVAWRFRTRVACPADAALTLPSVATYASVLVDGDVVARSETMWQPVVVPLAAGEHLVEVRCEPLADRLATPRRPRARWRTRVCDNALRFHRTTLIGRAPGFAPGPPLVGLARPAVLADGPCPPAVRLRPRVEGADGVLAVEAPDGVTVTLGDAAVTGSGELRVPGVRPWFPHTHGEPHRYRVVLARGGREWVRWVGFRTLETDGDLATEGLQARVNGVPVFVRGATWTPVPAGEERATLEAVVTAGMNAVRVVGWGAYETPAFHALCDELGVLVWQDLMFANLDYPFADAAFRATCRAEVAHQLEVVAGRPSLLAVCGNSESEQQVAMLGRDPTLARDPFFSLDVPELLEAAGVDAPYLPSAPGGAGRPIRPDVGVAHWFGVGGYRRPVRDVRAAGVRFAAECLAFANPVDAEPADEDFVPRDVGADWDFADARDHYLPEWFGAAGEDPARREALGRAVAGELMAEVFGEWRRAGSGCGGGFVLELRDRLPGPGWGLLDRAGRPKGVLGPLARALAPVAVWTTDEGQSGLRAHVANDGPAPLATTLRVSVYREGRQVVAEAAVPVAVAAHGAWSEDIEALLGHWLDVSYAYRFGPPQHDLVVVALEDVDGAVHGRWPAGRPALATADELGLRARREDDAVVLEADRAVAGVRVLAGAARPSDDAFLLEPGRPRTIGLAGDLPDVVRVTAIDLDAQLEVAAPAAPVLSAAPACAPAGGDRG